MNDMNDDYEMDDYKAAAEQGYDINDLSDLTFNDKQILTQVLLESMTTLNDFRKRSKEADTQLRESLYNLNQTLLKAGVDVKGEITEWDREYLALAAQKEKNKNED